METKLQVGDFHIRVCPSETNPKKYDFSIKKGTLTFTGLLLKGPLHACRRVRTWLEAQED